MAVKSKTVLREADVFEDDEARALRPVYDAGEFIEPVEPDAFTRIKAFCESGGQSGMLGIYRALPNRREQFITKLEVADFDPELIKGRFGGGDFIVKAYDENSKIRLNQRLSIEGDPIIESVKQIAPGLDVAALVAGMQESNRQLLSGLAHIMQPAPQPSRADMLAEMAAMRDLFAPAQSALQTDPTTILLKGIELARTLTPREGEASGMDVLLEIVRSFAPALSTVVAQNAQNTHPTKPVIAKPPVPKLTSQPQNEEEQSAMLLKYYLGILVGYAKQNRDVALYADLIADNLNIDQINGLLNRPDPVGYLIGIDPRVADVRPWFERVIAELKNLSDFTVPETSDSVIPLSQPEPMHNEPEATGDNATS